MATDMLSAPSAATPAVPTASTCYRSGAVARMLRMPVATLRIWERRYAVSQPALTPSGQRLYSADQVRRLALIKQLVDLGHAIGSLAALDMAQLQQVAATHAQTLAEAQRGGRLAPAAPAPMPWRLAVVGRTLAARLMRPGLQASLGRPMALLGPFDTLAQAADALVAAEVDAVLLYQPQLQANWLDDVAAAGPALAEVPKALLYRFAADTVCESLATAGVALLREPQPDAVLGQWLQHLAVDSGGASAPVAVPSAVGPPDLPPRRWDDAALADFAGLSSTIACECPRHVAELLMQLSHFEAYSAECAHRGPTDAALHRYLQQVAATARAQFEAALELVARHEGLLLPPAA